MLSTKLEELIFLLNKKEKFPNNQLTRKQQEFSSNCSRSISHTKNYGNATGIPCKDLIGINMFHQQSSEHRKKSDCYVCAAPPPARSACIIPHSRARSLFIIHTC